METSNLRREPQDPAVGSSLTPLTSHTLMDTSRGHSETTKQYILTYADPNSSVFAIYRQMEDTKVGHVGYFKSGL